MIKPVYESNGIVLFHGDASELLPQFAAQGLKVDAIATDPPYCSGGTMREATGKTPAQKYVLNGVALERPCFGGDQMDQRAFGLFTQQWMRQCLRLAKRRCYLSAFIDKRNAITLSDAMQLAGWRFTDLLPWDKTLGGSRPQKGWFRSQCEFALIGSIGSLGTEQLRTGKCHDGFMSCNRQPADKAAHMHAKPVAVMEWLLGPACEQPKATVLDPFCGSGSTLIAARRLGLRAVGIEREAANIAITIQRLTAELAFQPLTHA